MAWHLHAVEGEDGRWTCRHGLQVFDSHGERRAAIEHLKELAREFGRGTIIFVHGLGGSVEQIGDGYIGCSS